MNTTDMPKKKRKEVTESLKSAEKQRELKYLQDTFSSQIDPDVVYFVFSESSYNVDVALESLLSIASGDATKSSDDDAEKWNEKNKKITGKEQEDQMDGGNPMRQNQAVTQFENQSSVGASLYSSSQGLYLSNEDLCTEDGILGKFNSSDPFCFNSDILTSPLPSNCESATSAVLKSREPIHNERDTDAKSFDILNEVLSPQSDCSLEGDASDAIDSAFDIGVNTSGTNYASNLILNTRNQATFNPSSSIQTTESQFNHQPFFAQSSSYLQTASSSTAFVPRVPLSELFKRPQRFQVPKYQRNASPRIQARPKISTPVENVLRRLQQGEKILVILRGLPGSGKSTLAEKLVNRNGVICSTDNFFMHGSRYIYNPSKLSDAHEWNQLCTKKAMESGRSPVIIDNTNVEMWEMQPYCLWGTQYGYHIEILEPDTQWKFKVNELAIRNSHSIPREKIQLMLDRYQHNVNVTKILGKKLFATDKTGLNNSRDFQSPTRQTSNVLFEKTSTTPEKPPDLPLLTTPVLLTSLETDYVSEDPSFWHTDSGTQSDASVETVIEKEREEKVSPARSRFRNRQPQGDLKTVKDIVKDIVQTHFPVKDADSNSDGASESSNFWETSPIDNSQKNTESDTSPSKLDNIPESTFKRKTNKKLAAKFDQALLLNGHFSTDVDWKIPGYPEDKNDVVIPSDNSSTVVTQCAETCTQVDEKYFKPETVLSVSDVVLIAKDRDVSEITPVYQPNLSGKHDKSSMTMAECDSQLEGIDPERKFSSLMELFPQISEESLRDLFTKCNEDVNWVAELLLDPNYKFVDVKPFVPKAGNVNITDGFTSPNVFTQEESTSMEMVNSTLPVDSELDSAIDNALDYLPDSARSEDMYSMQFIPVERPILNAEEVNQRISVVKPVAVKTQTENYAAEKSVNGRSKSETLNDAGRISEFKDKGLILRLDSAFALQLEELFGQTNCSLDEENLELRLDLNLAEQIYNCWKVSLEKKAPKDHSERETSFEAYYSVGERSRLQQNLNLARRRSRSYDSATAKRQMDGEPDMEDIMRTEYAMYMAQNETADMVERRLKNADMATVLKKKLLHERFPHVDKTTLDNIYVANSCCKHITEEEVQASLENQMGMNDNYLPENTKSDITNPFYSCSKSTGPGNQRESTYDRSDVKNQDMCRPVLSASTSTEQRRTPSPIQDELAEDHRLEANFFFSRQRDYLAKADAARRSGQYAIAFHYTQEARNLKERMNNANHEAMLMILDENNRDNDPTVLDLHKLQVREAIAATKEFIAEHMKELLERRQPSITVYLITGRGKHSVSGYSRLKPEIVRFLNERKLRFNEPNVGMLAVTLKCQDHT